MMFQTAPPDRGFYNNTQLDKEGMVRDDKRYKELQEHSIDRASHLNSEHYKEMDILDRQLQEF